jgi:hypothetical protein
MKIPRSALSPADARSVRAGGVVRLDFVLFRRQYIPHRPQRPCASGARQLPLSRTDMDASLIRPHEQHVPAVSARAKTRRR